MSAPIYLPKVRPITRTHAQLYPFVRYRDENNTGTSFQAKTFFFFWWRFAEQLALVLLRHARAFKLCKAGNNVWTLLDMKHRFSNINFKMRSWYTCPCRQTIQMYLNHCFVATVTFILLLLYWYAATVYTCRIIQEHYFCNVYHSWSSAEWLRMKGLWNLVTQELRLFKTETVKQALGSNWFISVEKQVFFVSSLPMQIQRS